MYNILSMDNRNNHTVSCTYYSCRISFFRDLKCQKKHESSRYFVVKQETSAGLFVEHSSTKIARDCSFLHPTVRGSNRLVTQYHVIDSVKSSKAIKSMLHVLIVLIGSDDWIVKKLGLLLRTACRHNHQYS